MAVNRLTVLLCSALLSGLVSAKTVQDDWVNPAGPDRTTTVINGDSMKVEWTSDLQGWFETYCSECDTSNVNLWAESGDMSEQVASSIDVTTQTDFEWTIDVNNSKLASHTYWVLRFLASGQSDAKHVGDISSSIFRIKASDDNAKSSSDKDQTKTTAQKEQTKATSKKEETKAEPTTKEEKPQTRTIVATHQGTTLLVLTNAGTATEDAGAAQASDSSATITSATSTTEPSAAAASSGSGASGGSPKLSTGAKAGIGIGAAAGALLLLSTGAYFARRKSPDPEPAAMSSSDFPFPPPAPSTASATAPHTATVVAGAPQMAHYSPPQYAAVSPISSTTKSPASVADVHVQRQPSPYAELGAQPMQPAHPMVSELSSVNHIQHGAAELGPGLPASRV